LQWTLAFSHIWQSKKGQEMSTRQKPTPISNIYGRNSRNASPASSLSWNAQIYWEHVAYIYPIYSICTFRTTSSLPAFDIILVLLVYIFSGNSNYSELSRSRCPEIAIYIYYRQSTCNNFVYLCISEGLPACFGGKMST